MATTRLDVVATMSTLAYAPFLMARLASTINSLTKGRFGWNTTTSTAGSLAQLYQTANPVSTLISRNFTQFTTKVNIIKSTGGLIPCAHQKAVQSTFKPVPRRVAVTSLRRKRIPPPLSPAALPERLVTNGE